MKSGRIDINIKGDVTRELQKDEGFSLIEVLIAISIFAVGLLAVAAMQTSAIRVNSTAGQITDRTTLAQDKLEELMGLSYSDPWLQDLGDPPSGMDSVGNVHQETPDNYIISWTVNNNTPVSGTKLITVTVTARGKTTRLVSVKSQSL
jgi:type IV pilus assembly protein PilV